MGLDGGTLATRTDLLRRSSWRLANHDDGGQRSTRGGQLTADGALNTAGIERRGAAAEACDGYTSCTLSGARFPAHLPPGEIVACALGRLYLRSAVVEFLTRHGQFAEGQCDSSALQEACGHIERLRDVFSVALTPNDDEGAATGTLWRCPVDRDVTTNGQHAFVALRPCGHVLRERVALELARAAAGETGPSDGISTIERQRYTCPVCSAPVEVRVRLLPGAAETEKLRATLSAERAARQAKKKRKRAAGAAGESSGAAASSSETV
jgi:hypothetical protein